MGFERDGHGAGAVVNTQSSQREACSVVSLLSSSASARSVQKNVIIHNARMRTRTSVPVASAVTHVHVHRRASRTDDKQQVGRLLASRRAVHVLAARASRTDAYETGSGASN